jgi:isopenicillin-N epimerase
MERRDFLRLASAGAAAAIASGAGCAANSRRTLTVDEFESQAALAGSDDEFWHSVRAAYSVPTDHLDLDHASCAPTPRAVFDAFVERARRMSEAPAERFTKMWYELDEVTRPAVASYLGAEPRYVVFTQNTTTALNTVLHGFPLVAGDEILVTSHEYPDMVETVLQRARREGVVVRTVRVSSPDEERLALVARVNEVITSRTKLLLISHVSAWSGEVLPVKEVTAVARQHDVAVVVDAAQSAGIIEVDFNALGCDFLATSFHKGIGAPLPTGVLIMRPEHFGKVWPLHPPSWDTTKYPTDRYEWSGTFNMAALVSVGDALRFQRAIGDERKTRRLRLVSAYWQDRIRELPGAVMLTPRDSERWCGPAAFALETIASTALAKYLRSKHNILVQSKAGRHSPFSNAIRVSPAPHAELKELDRFVAAVHAAAHGGIEEIA